MSLVELPPALDDSAPLRAHPIAVHFNRLFVLAHPIFNVSEYGLAVSLSVDTSWIEVMRDTALDLAVACDEHLAVAS